MAETVNVIRTININDLCCICKGTGHSKPYRTSNTDTHRNIKYWGCFVCGGSGDKNRPWVTTATLDEIREEDTNTIKKLEDELIKVTKDIYRLKTVHEGKILKLKAKLQQLT